jgi:hypothetical protein
MADPVRVVITGAAGQIGYSLIYMVASGSVFGDDQAGVHFLPISISTEKFWDYFFFKFMDKSVPNIFDCIQFDGKSFGLIFFKFMDKRTTKFI